MFLFASVFVSVLGVNLIGIQCNSVCGYNVVKSLLHISNKEYFKSEYSNTISSVDIIGINTEDYIIDHTFSDLNTLDYRINTEFLQDNVNCYLNSQCFQKPVFNYNTMETDDFEIIGRPSTLIIYGPNVNEIHDSLNTSIYIDIDLSLSYHVGKKVDCNFNPDIIINVNLEYVDYVQKNKYHMNLPYSDNSVLIQYDKYTCSRFKIVESINDIKEQYHDEFKNHFPRGLFGYIKLILAFKIRELTDNAKL
jgi:hypothetical protein